MQDFLFFVGRFHVLALHLPIGIVIVAVALDWIARRERSLALARVSPFLWGAAAVSAVATAVLGYLHFAEGGFTGPSAEAHRVYGTVTALGCVAAWWLARGDTAAGALRLGAGVAVLALVSVTGHYGGNLTHGSTYLIEYAPGFLRSQLGAAEGRPPVTDVTAADPALVERLLAAGFLARQVSQDDARLVVGVSSPGMTLGEAGVGALAAAAPAIVDLNLSGTNLDDAGLAAIGPLSSVTHLRLARNRLTDGALAALAALPALEHLNLYGNTAITDVGLTTLAGSGSLRELYVWQTSVTERGVARLREQRPELDVDFGAAALDPAPATR